MKFFAGCADLCVYYTKGISMPKSRLVCGVLICVAIAVRIAFTADREEIPLAHGQSHDNLAIRGREKVTWRQAIGEQVVAQGIAWGRVSKGLGDRVILDGATIYVRPAVLDKQGRLVEVRGKLETMRRPPSPRTSQGYGPMGLEYYVITDAKCTSIDEVALPLVVIQEPEEKRP